MLTRSLWLVSVCAIALGAATFSCGGSSDDGGGGGGGAAGGATGGSGGATGGSGGATGGSGGATGGSGGGAAADIPSDTTKAGLMAWLAAENYKKTPWVAEPGGVRDSTNHGGKVHVWMNKTLVDSFKAGNGAGGAGGTAHARGAMAVKELFAADGTTLVGRAVLLKTMDGSGSANWIRYCNAPESARCANGGTDHYSSGTTGSVSCICHSDPTSIFSTAP